MQFYVTYLLYEKNTCMILSIAMRSSNIRSKQETLFTDTQ